MRAFELAHLLAERERTGQAYLEFVRVPSLNVGIYALAAGADDLGERVHPTEDEVYYVLGGRAVLATTTHERAVRQGDVVFMPAGVEHWFHGIDEDLTLLVFFAPVRA
jgi:mannose-6-phosphate isomerase-like protein (cupin superfamily)